MSELKVEQLLKRIGELEAELKSMKKYGLVWDKENTKENVVVQCEKNIPLLKNVKELNVINGDLNNYIIEGDNYHSLLRYLAHNL